MTETATLKVRMSREFLDQVADALGVNVAIGEPDADGFIEPVFTRRVDTSAPMNEDAALDLADDGPSTLGDEPLMDPRD